MASNTQDDGAEPGSDVAEAVGKEYAFIHGLLSKVLKSTTDKKPILKRLCADDPRNRTPGTEEERCTCNSCGRTGVGNSEDISMSQLIDSASLIGLMYSMGTMVNSYFSTDCSRLQKQGKSSAALSHDSYVDIVHTKLKDISSDLLGVDKSDATESECDDNDEQMLLDCLKKPTLPTHIIKVVVIRIMKAVTQIKKILNIYIKSWSHVNTHLFLIPILKTITPMTHILRNILVYPKSSRHLTVAI